MADNVDITEGSGTTIKTDDVSGVHYQYVKIADGTADSSTVVTADTYGLRVRRMLPVNKTSATGSAAIAATRTATANERLLSVTCHFSAAPTTSENFTITLDANDGAAYDTLLFSIDPSASSATDLVWFPDGDFIMENGDAIDVAFTNTDTVTYGVQITTETY